MYEHALKAVGFKNFMGKNIATLLGKYNFFVPPPNKYKQELSLFINAIKIMLYDGENNTERVWLWDCCDVLHDSDNSGFQVDDVIYTKIGRTHGESMYGDSQNPSVDDTTTIYKNDITEHTIQQIDSVCISDDTDAESFNKLSPKMLQLLQDNIILPNNSNWADNGILQSNNRIENFKSFFGVMTYKVITALNYASQNNAMTFVLLWEDAGIGMNDYEINGFFNIVKALKNVQLIATTRDFNVAKIANAVFEPYLSNYVPFSEVIGVEKGEAIYNEIVKQLDSDNFATFASDKH